MKLHEVFGVSKDPVASYVERDAVDASFSVALKSTRQIVVYGSSKQGKTALLQRHVEDKNRVTVHCGPKTSVEDIYRSLLRQRGVEIVTEKSTGANKEFHTTVSVKFKAMLPVIFGGEVETAGGAKAGDNTSQTMQPIEFNLSTAQDVGELLHKVAADGVFNVLENFHYLSEEVQKQLAFDLRTFEEMGLRFVILGVWRERNRLVQYNGDLQDRIAEVPVEPWEIPDFSRIVASGENELNIEFSNEIKKRIFIEAHGSVAVVQELLKKVCENAEITETVKIKTKIEHEALLVSAINDKVEEYTARHVRSLEAIAAGSRTRRATEDAVALFLPYYFVYVLVHRNYEELKDGIERKTLQELIRKVHAHPQNVRTSDVTGMLIRLPALQAEAQIVPPLFDFDRGNRRIKVVDSTLYFFIDNCNPEEVMAEIPHPDTGLTVKTMSSGELQFLPLNQADDEKTSPAD